MSGEKIRHPLSGIPEVPRLYKHHASALQPPHAASYVVFKVGVTYYAKNGSTGAIDFSGTDAAAVIQDALGALPTAGGKLFIKAGSYPINTMISIKKDNVVLEGEGIFTKLVGAAKDMDTIERWGVRSNVQIRDLYVECNGTDPTNSPIDCDNARYCMFENLRLKTKQQGFTLHADTDDCFRNTVRNLFVEGKDTVGTYAFGVYLLAGVYECRENAISNVIVRGMRRSLAIVGDKAIRNAVTNLISISPVDYGVYISGRRNAISNVVDSDAGLLGIVLDGPLNRLTNVVVTRAGVRGIEILKPNNSLSTGEVSYCQEHGIRLYDANATKISGFDIYNNSQKTPNTWAGIYMGPAEDCVIVGNRCYDDQPTKTQRYGIWEGGASDYNLLHGNDLRGNATAGISYVGPNSVVTDIIT